MKKEKSMFSSTAPSSKTHKTSTKECSVDFKNKTSVKLDNAVKHMES